ncbi:hypothetical protein [Shimazuella kribbensis]|uniref:hypothetical protein n=1 Tax=Shimazuella kribbensis TaxID=139808 RepID=UPI0004912CE0|nr:hypothetical protein [Shimazuella kribbensis]
MFEYLDSLYRSAASTGAMIIIITTCVVVIYLLFNLSPIIENLIQKNNTQESVIVDNKEIHINIKNRTYEIKFDKLKSLFWRFVGIAYLIGLLLAFAIVVVIPLVLIVVLAIKKGLRYGVVRGIRSVLRLPSPK